MQHTLMQLPYEMTALEPYMSKETLEFHYGKHHKAYVDKLNSLIVGTEYENMSLEEVILASKQGPIFNNAAQIWNHNLFWNLMKINNGANPTGVLLEHIERDFGSVESFKEAFKNASLGLFGSGWVWLVKGQDGKLKITSTQNASNPLMTGETALLGCDVWEHAYYIDYRNNRGGFIDGFWNIVDWDFVASKV